MRSKRWEAAAGSCQTAAGRAPATFRDATLKLTVRSSGENRGSKQVTPGLFDVDALAGDKVLTDDYRVNCEKVRQGHYPNL